jgi:hypothetical protein
MKEAQMNNEIKLAPQKDSFDYILFDVIPKSDQQPIDEQILKSLFKNYFSQIIDHPFNILYPVHDKKCYFCSTESQCFRIKNELERKDGLIKTRHIDIAIFNYVDNDYVTINFSIQKPNLILNYLFILN